MPDPRLWATVGIKNILYEHHLQTQTQSTPGRRLDPYLQVEWLKWLKFDLYSYKFEYVDDPIADMPEIRPTGTVRRPLSVATGNFVAGGSAGYENQALICSLIALNHDIRPTNE